MYSSIQKGTPVEVVQRAIDLLDNEFGAEPEIRYTELIKRLRESFDHDAFRSGNLLGRIMMVRNKPASQIGPDPAETLPRPTASSASGSQANNQRQVLLSGRDLVFNTLLQHITGAVEKRSPEGAASYRQNFLKEALNMGLSRECATKLVSWSKSNASMSTIAGTDAELHKIINTAFVWMCGKFGPVEADKILLHAVKMTEQLPDAFEHSPRKFL